MIPIDKSYFENPIWLAPMAGVTDKAFRTLCLEHGAGLTYTEMISAKALEYANERTFALAEPAPLEEKIAVQLFGHEPDVMARQAAALAERMGDAMALIDVNMGCPVLKVCKKGEGSALMKTPELAAEIIRAMAAALDPFGIPVTAKFRSGWDASNINAVDFASRLEDAGAAALGVHGRTSKQMYRGKSDWDVVSQVVQSVSVPVIGSGDIYTAQDIDRALGQYGAKAVFAARGARGNPWIFERREPTQLERVTAARQHLDLYVKFYGDAHLSPLRAQLACYVHGQPNAADVRRALGGAVTLGDYSRIMDIWEQQLTENED